MGTWHEDGVRFVVNELVLKDADAAVTISRYCVKMNSGLWSDDYVDAIVQKFSGSYDIYDAYVFAKIHAEILEGLTMFQRIHVGERPSADRFKDSNRAKLGNLMRPFRATITDVRGAAANDDGRLKWDEAITFGQHLGDGRIQGASCPPWIVPLEIGTTASSRTLAHLGQCGAVARWPYDHEHITLLVRRILLTDISIHQDGDESITSGSGLATRPASANNGVER
jgi:hypothetical protein